jgi:hypothetical protein
MNRMSLLLLVDGKALLQASSTRRTGGARIDTGAALFL